MILPYCKPAQSIAEHQAVYDSIVARLEESGFTQASAKLDPACRSGVQSFYLPCTNRAYPEWAFFETFGTDQKDFARHALNPQFIAKVIPVPGQDDIRASKGSALTSAAISKITAPLLGMTEGRHEELHKVVWRLKAGGVTDTEVWLHLPYPNEAHIRKKVRASLNSWRREAVKTASPACRQSS